MFAVCVWLPPYSEFTSTFPMLFLPQKHEICTLFEQVMNVAVSTKWVCQAFLSNVDFKKLCEMGQVGIMFLRTYKPEK